MFSLFEPSFSAMTVRLAIRWRFGSEGDVVGFERDEGSEGAAQSERVRLPRMDVGLRKDEDISKKMRGTRTTTTTVKEVKGKRDGMAQPHLGLCGSRILV